MLRLQISFFTSFLENCCNALTPHFLQEFFFLLQETMDNTNLEKKALVEEENIATEGKEVKEVEGKTQEEKHDEKEGGKDDKEDVTSSKPILKDGAIVKNPSP